MTRLLRWLIGVKFVIEIRDGIIDVQGDVPEEYVKDVERICELWAIKRGVIKGVRRGKQIDIDVGGGIDKQHAMAFKNAWRIPL